MLEDYRFSEDMSYASHRLVIRGKDIEIGGVLGAALVSALLVDTDEGNRRGIAIDSEAEQIAWIKKYEREVRREEWGLLTLPTYMQFLLNLEPENIVLESINTDELTLLAKQAMGQADMGKRQKSNYSE